MLILYQQYISPLDAIYVGKAQKAIFTFSLLPEQLDFINDFFVNRYVNECKNTIEENSPGDDLLQLTLYKDTAPTWKTNYKCEIIATDRTGYALPWTIIIVASLALIVYYLIVRPLLNQVIDLLYGPLGPDGERRRVNLIGYIPWIVIGIGVVMLAPAITRKEVKYASQ